MLPFQSEPCKPHSPDDITSSVRGRRVATLLLRRLERRAREVAGKHWGAGECLERRLARFAAGDERPCHQFFLPRQIADSALGDHLSVTAQTESLEHRLHDWISCGQRVIHTSDYFLSAANWSPLLQAVVDCPVLAEARELQSASFAYRETAAYAHYLRRKDEGRSLVRNQVKLDTTAKVDAYFERFVELFDSIDGHGFLRLRQARGARRALDQPSRVRRWLTIWGEKDVSIALTADRGPVLLPGGKHRLAIARVLNLPEIPVRVGMLHLSWLRQLGPVPLGQWVEAIASGLAASFNSAGNSVKSE